MGCSRARQQPSNITTIAVVHDTVIITDTQYIPVPVAQYARDSAYLSTLREEYAQRQYGYLREMVRMDSLVSLLWDGIGTLADENQNITEKAERLWAEAAGLQERLSATVAPAPTYSEALVSNNSPEDKTKSWRTRSQWLLAQPRTIYTVGADGEAGEVEVTRCQAYGAEMYVAVAVETNGEGENVENTGEAAATLNGVSALYRYSDKNGQVFVFRLPQLTGTVQMEFVIDNRSYMIKTNIKNLL
jgi:hypothetical protein